MYFSSKTKYIKKLVLCTLPNEIFFDLTDVNSVIYSIELHWIKIAFYVKNKSLLL